MSFARNIGTERLVSQLKVQLRRFVYGEILIQAVLCGKKDVVEAALARGGNWPRRAFAMVRKEAEKA